MSRTLFDAPVPLVSGSVVLCVVSALVAHRLGGIVPTAAALAFVIVGTTRIGILVAYLMFRASPRGHGRMASWRGAYAAGTLASSLTLGLLTAYCLFASDDPVSHVILVATAVGYGSGVAGRNAACPEASLPQLFAVLLPTAAGLLAHGDVAYAVLGATVLAFGHGMTHISRSIHASIAGAHRSTQEREVFAERLADALGTMHHGFCLLDAEGRVVTGSASLGTLLRIPVPAPGTDAAGIAAACEANDTRARGGARLASVIANLAVVPRPTTRDVPLEDGRTLAFTATPKEGGGCVLILEDVTERVAAEARLVCLARHDSLTGLLNRAAAGETLDRCISRGEPVALHLIDLDRFKGVNDSFGHSVGDGLLRAVASRIAAILPEGAHAARLGGDEFLVLQVGHVSEAPALAAAIAAAVDAPYEVEGRELSISASIGCSAYPSDGNEAGTLMRNADTALYQVKTGGRHGWRAFDPAMDEAARERREMEGDLREAVAARAFEVVYQPQMDLATGATTTYEALVRWDRPGRGPVSPADFIPLAEETGLIHAIGRIVLEMACGRPPAGRRARASPSTSRPRSSATTYPGPSPRSWRRRGSPRAASNWR